MNSIFELRIYQRASLHPSTQSDSLKMQKPKSTKWQHMVLCGLAGDKTTKDVFICILFCFFSMLPVRTTPYSVRVAFMDGVSMRAQGILCFAN